MGTIAPVILEELQEESRKWEQRIAKEAKQADTSNGTAKNGQENQEEPQENGKTDEAADHVNSKAGSPVPGRKINGNGKEKKLRCEEDPECIDYDYRYSNLVQAAADYED